MEYSILYEIRKDIPRNSDTRKALLAVMREHEVASYLSSEIADAMVVREFD